MTPMRENGGDVIVVGAGLIGLAIAFELADRGASVRVFDRGEPGRGASWAGAGMLAPYTERITDQAFLALGTASLAEYPAFVQRVYAASGVDARLHLNGVLYAAFEESEMDALHRHAQELRARGVDCEMLDRAGVLAAEAWLSAGVIGGLIKSAEGYVDNRRLGRALVGACQSSGVVVERSSRIAVECDDRRVLGVATARGFIAARSVVNACGAWAAQLGGVPRCCLPPIKPVKGQMIALAIPVGFVRRATWVPGAYLVPRDDGRLLVGATVEPEAFDERVTARGVSELLDAALAGAPALADFTPVESWAGLRPGTPDGLPILGPTLLDGFFLATGHYRNGILLAPATARLIANAIETNDVAGLEPFALGRFDTEVAAAKRSTSA
jgi:glycine oxidase